jgi:hypothetical protein
MIGGVGGEERRQVNRMDETGEENRMEERGEQRRGGDVIGEKWNGETERTRGGKG